MPMIQIDPDDYELKIAIQSAEEAIKKMQRADRDWNRAEPSMEKYTAQYETLSIARKRREHALIKLAELLLERL